MFCSDRIATVGRGVLLDERGSHRVAVTADVAVAMTPTPRTGVQDMSVLVLAAAAGQGVIASSGSVLKSFYG